VGRADKKDHLPFNISNAAHFKIIIQWFPLTPYPLQMATAVDVHNKSFT
jgi:hypothetical protein